MAEDSKKHKEKMGVTKKRKEEVKGHKVKKGCKYNGQGENNFAGMVRKNREKGIEVGSTCKGQKKRKGVGEKVLNQKKREPRVGTCKRGWV